MPVLLDGGDGLDVLKVKRIPFDILKLSIVFEVHPGSMALCHINRLLRHVLQVNNAWLDNLLGLKEVQVSVITWIADVAYRILCDQLRLVFIKLLLASGGLSKLLIGLEHLLED